MLPAAGWDSLLGVEDFFQTPRWLTVQERTGGTTLEYLLLHRAAGLTAGLVTAWADETVPWLLARPDALLRHACEEGLDGAQRCREAVDGDLTRALLPALVCGGRHLGRTRALALPGASRADLADLLAAAAKLAAERGAASICFPHVDARDGDLAGLLAALGYHGHVSAHYCWLPVPEGGFEEYLAQMTQHRRRRVRLERRALAAAGVQVRVEPLTAGLTRRLGELDASLLAKYGNPADPARSAKILSGIAEVMGDDALVSLAWLAGEVIGFGLVLRSRAGSAEHWFGHRAGFDYAAQGRLPLYYEVLYYSVMEAAAAAGVTVMHAGIGSTEAKLARGCVASEQRSFFLQLPAAAARTGARGHLAVAGVPGAHAERGAR
jgi:hypothetical protein